MKNRLETYLLFPRKSPKTIYSLEKWHRKLLRDCIYYEFEIKAICTGIKSIKNEIKKYVAILKNGEFSKGCRLALDRLNELLSEWERELAIKRGIVKSIHMTNEFIINSLFKAFGDDESIEKIIAKYRGRKGNILHEPGWLAEYEYSNLDRKKFASFITFGTAYDNARFDVIKIPKPLRRIRLVRYNRKQKE